MDPQVKEVVEALKGSEENKWRRLQMEPPLTKGMPKTKWRGLYSLLLTVENLDTGGGIVPREVSEERSLNSERRVVTGLLPRRMRSQRSTEDGLHTDFQLQSARRPARKKKKLSDTPQYYNPDQVARMFGRANEAKVEVNGVSTTCLVHTGTTVTISQ